LLIGNNYRSAGIFRASFALQKANRLELVDVGVEQDHRSLEEREMWR
jgi:hypothetical protein